MHRILLTTLAITATLMAMAPAADNMPPKGFTALFNDKDFTGCQARQGGVESEVEKAEWREHWKVENGVIKFDGQGPTLWTSKKFKDFVLMVDWRFPKSGDSGIYLRGSSKSQVNIWCDEMGSGEVWGYRTDESQSEEVRKACTPARKMDKPVGQWNTFAITMKGNRLTVELNGQVVINNAQLPGVPVEGEIGLQQHGCPIEFKNIYLKEVSPAAEPTGEAPARADEKAQAAIDEVEKECINRGIRLLAPQKAKRLAELLRQVKPRVVVECGTAVGYSGLWIARELKVADISIAAAAEASGSRDRGAPEVERWDIFEVTLEGPDSGNPFVEVELSASFTSGDRVVEVDGFYDGDGVYRIRFMPESVGEWRYITRSNWPELDGRSGKFTCVKPSPGNHGPVRVHKTYHLVYADGTPYFQVGTTCYAWAHQGDELEEQTLATLKRSPFNKMRMCVFPKSYAYNQNEPKYYPFEGKPLRNWDTTRFNPDFFRHFEKRIADLRDLGIEADLVLFHPYDRWGFANMGQETDDCYLQYIAARFAAYRNVWWSMANEYDLMKSKTMDDWDRFFQIVQKHDPYQHMRGIHNCRGFYDHTKPWVTHCSIQSSDFARAIEWREMYKKPVIYDECQYEGNVPQGWGNLAAEELVRRFWLGTIAGCYVGHGETYKHPEDILWWSKGGVLHGQSPSRIAFLKKLMEPTPFAEMVPSEPTPGSLLLSKSGELYLVYFNKLTAINLTLPGERPYKVDSIDTWQMTITSLGSARSGEFNFTPPKADMLLRLTPYKPGERMRPEAQASAAPKEGVAPLRVQFSTPTKLKCEWSFGDGSASNEQNPAHVYAEPGLYTAALTVTDEAGLSSSASFVIAADRDSDDAIVRVGFIDGDLPRTKLHGNITRGKDGSYVLGDREPWKWISVGDKPIEALEGLRSFTILGWVYATSLNTGSGGNRIAFNLDYDRAGFDLVCLQDGRLRLAVNEWPDGVRNDSSAGKIALNRSTFFALTYDGTKEKDNVAWYFGDSHAAAKLDRRTTYFRGPTGKGSGPLALGNYNETIQRHGQDRQFRGRIRGIQIFGSRIGPRGALSLSQIQQRQEDK